MKRMKQKEKTSLSHMSIEELVKELGTIQAKLRFLRVERHTKHMKNTREARGLRLKIAVIETFIRQKELSV